MLFDLGRIVATPGAIKAMEAAGVSAADLLQRHVAGDWGEVDSEDKATNDRAVRVGERILSSYPIGGPEPIWLITEWDRSASTLLLPSEY